MLQRLRLTFPLAAVAAALVLAALPAPALAVNTASFSLTPKPGVANITNYTVTVVPPFKIAATNPVTILPGSSGFNQDDFRVLLGKGNDVQDLILFFGQTPKFDANGKLIGSTPILGPGGKPDPGLAPNGVVNFGVNLDPSYQGTLDLVPTAAAAQLATISRLAPQVVTPGGGSGDTTGSGGSTTPTTPTPTTSGDVSVPEPLSLVLWSSLAALGLVRARAFRRSHAPTA